MDFRVVGSRLFRVYKGLGGGSTSGPRFKKGAG